MTNLLLIAIALLSIEWDGHANPTNGLCVGPLQQKPCYVQEANRILGRDEFTLDDRLDETRAVVMWYIVTWHHAKPDWTVRDFALFQKKGPTGMHRNPSPDDIDYVTRAENIVNQAQQANAPRSAGAPP